MARQPSARVSWLLVCACASALPLVAPPAARAAEEADETADGEKASEKPAAPEKSKKAASDVAEAAETEDDESVADTRHTRVGRRTIAVGLSPQDTLVAGDVVAEEAETGSSAWKFDFHGFFRAPMRLGFDSLSDPGPEQSSLQIHSPPVVPDGNYTRWAYTNAAPGPWVEMLFQYGNNRAKMTAAIASYNITAGGWRELQAQLGIDRAFLTIDWPELLGDRGRVTWNVGVFSNRYGAMGRYDAGAYETYIMGRTRIAGETFTFDLDVGPHMQLYLEHGIGAKLDQQKWTTRAVGNPAPYESFEPYPGPVQQGTTLLHHAHAGIGYGGVVTLMGHYLNAFTADARATGEKPNASMRVVGADLRLIGGWLGDGYLGFSSAKATNVNALADALELIHSQGGWQFTNNYLGGEGYGTVNTLAFQYTFSVAAFLLRPQSWWGDGADLTLQVFGMYNTVSGGEVDADGATLPAVTQFRDINGRKKFKVGGQALYTPLPFLSFGARVDRVQPNLDNARQSFTLVSPRAFIRTEFVTREQVMVQYSFYSYGSETQLPYPFAGPGATFNSMGRMDKGVLTLSASMWW